MSQIPFKEQLLAVYHRQKLQLLAEPPSNFKFRVALLDSLETQIHEHLPEIIQALRQDLSKPESEVLTAEVGSVLEELRNIKKKLQHWMRPQKVFTPFPFWPAKAEITSEPLGQVLIIAPWNYPFQLCMSPLIGALAAGNRVILKPSELTPETAQVIESICKAAFKTEQVWVAQGGIPETTEILSLRFDHIFYTGNGQVGRIIMKAASQFLTPVTLELGGKSPTIVTQSSDLEDACKKIAWGKWMNAGQTCVAPDFVLVHEKVFKAFIETLNKTIEEFYPSLTEYGGIVSERHFERLNRLLTGLNSNQIWQSPRHLSELKKSAAGGDSTRSLKFPPTLISEPSEQSPLMEEEIFGPILPILKFTSFDKAIAQLKKSPKPLAAYLFSKDPNEIQKFTRDFSFGGGCINDVILHLAHPHLPFGGVGESGMGAYHGKKSFDTFSHFKSIYKASRFWGLPMRFPPISKKKLSLLRWLLGVR